MNCNEELTDNQMFRNSGCCVNCGHCNDGSIVNANTSIFAKKRVSPWWVFWSVKYKYIPLN